MNERQVSTEFLDQLLGFQQALGAALHVDDMAVLICRMAMQVAGAAEARLCLEGLLLTPPGAPSEVCKDCTFLRNGLWIPNEPFDQARHSRCPGAQPGWRSLTVRTQRRLHGYLLLLGCAVKMPNDQAAAIASVVAVAALALENSCLQRRLDASTRHAKNLGDALERSRPVPVPGSADHREAGRPWPARGAVRIMMRAIEQAPASIVVTSPDGVIKYVNPGFIRSSGYQSQEVVGHTPRMLKSGLSPVEEYSAMWQVISAGEVWRGEFHNRRKDGSLYWVSATIAPVLDDDGAVTNYIAVEEDISEVKALQERLWRSDESYRGASEASHDGLFILDAIRDAAGGVADFRFAQVNAVGCAMLSEDRRNIIGRQLCELLGLARGERFLETYRRVFLRREAHDEQFESDGLTGRPGWIHQTVVPLGYGVAVTSRDISAVKRVEAELIAARAAAEQASAAKSLFLATMSHELRTPLNAILGFSELIRDQAFGPDEVQRYARYAGDIHASGQHLLELITSILDLSKIEAGKLEIAPSPIEIGRLLGQCLTLVRQPAESQGLSLDTDFAPDMPVLLADVRAVRQMVLNLLSNAVKYTLPGGAIRLRAVLDGPYMVAISVTDTGIGIPEHHIERVMKPFEQLDNSYTRGFGGTGLGLALVKSLAGLHDGSVMLESV
ncbi:MAG: PAS domain-containing protein, partial [Rhodospirillaceae bacterium]